MNKFRIVLTFVLTTVFASNAKIDDFIRSLPKEEHQELETFCQRLLKSLAGYVLFGDKPLCIEDIAIRNFDIPPIFCESQIVEIKGGDFFIKLSKLTTNSEFPIIIDQSKNPELLVFVNKQAFLKTVNENISLFRYILGSTLTAESLLSSLLENGNRFYDILKNNKLLLGILLGYGTQNSLVGARQEDLLGELGDDRIIFPYKNYETFIQAQHTPSFGFSNLEEEHQTLLKSLSISTEIKQFKECPIPYFGCVPSSQETQTLLETYVKNREKILRVVNSKECLKKTLERLFTGISDDVDTSSLKKQHHFSPQNRDVLAKFAACISSDLNHRTGNFRIPRENIIQWFLQGVKLQTSGGHIQWEQNFCPDVTESYLTLKRSNLLMKNIAQAPGIIEQVPKYLYYKILQQGRGQSAANITTVTFQFSLYDPHHKLLECGTVKGAKLKDLIPGMAHLFTGMKRKEEREAYIHPKFCYGLLPQASPMHISVKLIDFDTGDTDFALPAPIELSLRYFEPVDIAIAHTDPNYFNEGPFLRDLEDFLPFIQQRKKELRHDYIKFGYDCCEKLQKAGIAFDLKKWNQLLHSSRNEKTFQNQEEMREFIMSFNSSI